MPNLYDRFLEFLSPAEILEATPALLNDQRRRFVSEPDIILQPHSIENVQEIMRFCFEHRIPVTPQGGNTGLCGAAVASGGVLLNLSKINRIREINLADNSITVEAGVILQNVQKAAAEAGRLFPLSLASEGSCEIGGNIACNAGGLNVLRYGSMRDLVLGLEVVLPNGELVSHLQPLHKNTTGYDLRHLFIGSEGTLGIITAATLKLFARPQTIATAWVGLDDIESAVQLLTAVQGHFAERLTSFELISRYALTLSSEFSHLKQPIDANWHVLLELTDSVPDAALDEKLAEFLYQNGQENSIIAQSEQERLDLWTLRENISASQRKLGTSIKHDIAVPIAQVAAFVRQCAPALKTRFPGIQIVCFGHLGDGSLHYNTFLPDVLSNDAYRYEDAVNSIVYEHILACHGTIAAEHGIGTIKKHWLPSVRTPSEIALMRAIKATPSAPASVSRKSILCRPMPCSPVQVPPSDRASETISRLSASARATSSGLSTSTRIRQWKLPSPTWPTISDGKPLASSSLRAPSTEAARREMGTQVSVEMARAPGRICRPAK